MVFAAWFVARFATEPGLSENKWGRHYNISLAGTHKVRWNAEILKTTAAA